MLQPKKTKFRRQQKGSQKGNAQRGNQLAFGSFGIKSLETKWITGRQIEAARIAVTRYMQRQGQIWISSLSSSSKKYCSSCSRDLRGNLNQGSAPSKIVSKSSSTSSCVQFSHSSSSSFVRKAE